MGTLPQQATIISGAQNRHVLETAVQKKDYENQLVPGLTSELEAKLVQVAQRHEDENYVTWRFLFRIFLEAQMFWKDQQYGYYDYRSDTYRTVSGGGSPITGAKASTNASLNFQYVTNIYKAFGWTVVSVLGQKRPSVVFLPNDYTNEDDVVAARAAEDVVPILERANEVPLLHMMASLWLYTDGIAAGYVRYVIDGERFGYHEKKIVRLMPKGQRKYSLCPQCGAMSQQDEGEPAPNAGFAASLRGHNVQTGGIASGAGLESPPMGQQPLESRANPLPYQPAAWSGSPSPEGHLPSRYRSFLPQPPRVEGATEIAGRFPLQTAPEGGKRCAECGSALGRKDVYTEDAESLEVVGISRKPKGQVLITVHSGLETRLPPYVYHLKDYPFISLQHEVHVSQLRSTYGERAKNVTGGSAGPYDTWDRFARLMLTEPHGGSYYSLANQNLVTLKEYWLRPSEFYMLEASDRDALLEIFPKGAYLAYEGVGMRILDARKEDMGDHWAVCHALEGPGNYTPSIGSSCISIQKRYNTIHNFIMEWVEYAAAGQGTFVNTGLVAIDALRRQRRAPGMLYPVRLPPNVPIANAIYDSRPGAIANETFTYGTQLVQMGQLVTGAVPTVSGGTEKSLKPTTYLTDREQALGRLYVPWQHLRHFWARIMLLGVKEFARCELNDVNYTLQGSDGSAINKTVHLDQLQGNFDAYPEVNEDFPRLLHQQQALYLSMLNSTDETVKQILADPRNLPYVKTLFGWPSIFVPGEDDIMKQKREISRLLLEKPVMQASPTGQPIVLPSIQPDVYADNHALHDAIVKAWAVSREGITAKDENPLGFANVEAHGKMHEHILQRLQAQAAQAQVQAEMQKDSAKIGAAQVATKGITEQIRQAEQAGATQAGMAQGAPGMPGGPV